MSSDCEEKSSRSLSGSIGVNTNSLVFFESRHMQKISCQYKSFNNLLCFALLILHIQHSVLPVRASSSQLRTVRIRQAYQSNAKCMRESVD